MVISMVSDLHNFHIPTFQGPFVVEDAAALSSEDGSGLHSPTFNDNDMQQHHNCTCSPTLISTVSESELTLTMPILYVGTAWISLRSLISPQLSSLDVSPRLALPSV
jgi:hypothetical protein